MTASSDDVAQRRKLALLRELVGTVGTDGLPIDSGVRAETESALRELIGDPNGARDAGQWASGAGVDLLTHTQWPAESPELGVPFAGHLSRTELAEPGRAIARLDGLGWSGGLEELFVGSDGELPVPTRRAAAQVLDSWPQMRGAVEAVVAVRSTTRPILIGHLATGLARYLSVPLVGAVGPRAGHDAPTSQDDFPADRCAAVVKRLELQMNAPALAGLPGRRVLLVDDFTKSGWTLAIAAKLLRDAGAAAVYPFVLAIR